MPIMFDFKCTSCGKIITDHLLTRCDDPAPNCPECNEIMEKIYTGFNTPHGAKHHHKIPSNYKPGRGVNFGKIKDL